MSLMLAQHCINSLFLLGNGHIQLFVILQINFGLYVQ